MVRMAVECSAVVFMAKRIAPLPEARVIIIVVPVTVFCIYWFVLRKRPRP